MKRVWAVVLISMLILPSRAVATRASGSHAGTVRLETPAVHAPDQNVTDRSLPDVWRQFARQVPVGSVLKIRTMSGERVTATLLAVDDVGITVKPKTRVPEPIRQVPFDTITDLQLKSNGTSLAKAAAIGAGVGAGAFLGLFLIFLASVAD